jgi:UDP-2-acetamido-2,6-beta-L-arabino-hexul-4-ose reductase
MNVLVTGANGFIGKNLVIRLNELDIHTEAYTRENSAQNFPDLLKKTDFIVHLAGENRPEDEDYFELVNSGLTSLICDEIRLIEKDIPIIIVVVILTIAFITCVLLDHYGYCRKK